VAVTFTGHRVVRVGLETGEELVCILFSDLVGWTAMNDRLGDAAGDALRRRHFTDLRRALRSHRAREIKSVDDGMMAVFRSVLDALVCAADIGAGPSSRAP
jgi:class 3 adenylate cyclase